VLGERSRAEILDALGQNASADDPHRL
jgi:hypothetical protein